MATKLTSGEITIQIPDPPGGVRTDFSHWPVAIVRPPARKMTDDEYRAYLDWTRKYIVCVGRPYAMVLDATEAAPVSPGQRKILSDHMAQTRPFSSKYCAGVAMVFDSTVMRGVMTAVLWMSAPEYPTKVFANTLDATLWCREALRELQGREAMS